MKIAALVPFKCFTRAKSRLRSCYSDAEVEAIGRAMLEDVLTALCASRHLSEVSVLTDDAAVAEVGRAAGAKVRLRAPDPGLNAAIDDANQGEIRNDLTYGDRGEKILQDIQRSSRPGRRVYVGCSEIPRVLNGLGISIVSTSRGVLSDREARKDNLGGELLCTVW